MKTLIVVFLICLFVFVSMSRNSIWMNEIILWTDTMNKSPVKLRPVFNLARSYQKAGDFKLAEYFYLRAAHLFPENPDIYNNLGNIYQNTERIDEAIDFYRTGLQFKETVELYFNLGSAYEKKGDRASAIYCYRQALRLNPEDEEVKERLSRLLNNQS
jgi:tetratricopeptide (TPR) repeat protein